MLQTILAAAGLVMILIGAWYLGSALVILIGRSPSAAPDAEDEEASDW